MNGSLRHKLHCDESEGVNVAVFLGGRCDQSSGAEARGGVDKGDVPE